MARYCFPGGRLSPRQREAGAKAKAASPGGLGGPRPAGGRAPGGKEPRTHPAPSRPATHAGRSRRGPDRMAGLGKRGRPAHPRSAPLRAMLCPAVPCSALPGPAVPYLHPPGASCRKGGPGAPRGADGERGRAGAGLSGGQAVAATCAQPSLRRRLKTDIKAAGGEERGGQLRAGGAAPPDAGRSAHPPACSSISAGGGREEADAAADGPAGRGPDRTASIPGATLRHGGCLISVLIPIPCRLCAGLLTVPRSLVPLSGAASGPPCPSCRCGSGIRAGGGLRGGLQKGSRRTGGSFLGQHVGFPKEGD